MHLSNIDCGFSNNLSILHFYIHSQLLYIIVCKYLLVYFVSFHFFAYLFIPQLFAIQLNAHYKNYSIHIYFFYFFNFLKFLNIFIYFSHLLVFNRDCLFRCLIILFYLYRFCLVLLQAATESKYLLNDCEEKQKKNSLIIEQEIFFASYTYFQIFVLTYTQKQTSFLQ